MVKKNKVNSVNIAILACVAFLSILVVKKLLTPKPVYKAKSVSVAPKPKKEKFEVSTMSRSDPSFAACGKNFAQNGIELAKYNDEPVFMSGVSFVSPRCDNCLARAQLQDGTSLVLMLENSKLTRASTQWFSVCGSVEYRKARQAYIRVKSIKPAR